MHIISFKSPATPTGKKGDVKLYSYSFATRTLHFMVLKFSTKNRPMANVRSAHERMIVEINFSILFEQPYDFYVTKSLNVTLKDNGQKCMALVPSAATSVLYIF